MPQFTFWKNTWNRGQRSCVTVQDFQAAANLPTSQGEHESKTWYYNSNYLHLRAHRSTSVGSPLPKDLGGWMLQRHRCFTGSGREWTGKDLLCNCLPGDERPAQDTGIKLTPATGEQEEEKQWISKWQTTEKCDLSAASADFGKVSNTTVSNWSFPTRVPTLFWKSVLIKMWKASGVASHWSSWSSHDSYFTSKMKWCEEFSLWQDILQSVLPWRFECISPVSNTAKPHLLLHKLVWSEKTDLKRGKKQVSDRIYI